MPQDQVTFDDKDKTLPTSDPRRLIRDVDVNELKSVINANATDVTNSLAAIKNATADMDSFGEVVTALTAIENSVSALSAAVILLASFKTNIVPTGTINGSNTAFTLPHTPLDGTVEGFADTLHIIEGTHFTRTGPNITMVIAPTDSLVFNYIV
jgi:hypothetical protein